jgi:hypothetical protein
MRLAIATLTLLVVTTTGAWAAADCSYTPTLAPDARSGTIIFDSIGGFTVAPSETASCSATVAVAIPNGTFGVYKVDSRGSIDLNAHDSAVYSVQHVQTQQSSLAGPLSVDPLVITQYFGSGPSTDFTGTFTFDLTNATTGAQGVLDTVDILAGYTTLASVQGSVNALADEETGIVTRLNATGDLLLGHNQPLEAPDNFSVFGAVGSHTFGAPGTTT